MTTRKLLPLTGIVFVGLIVLVFVVSGSTPEPDATAAKVSSFYNAHEAREFAAAFLLAASVPFVVAFAITLATAVWPADRDTRPLWEVVLVAGGVLGGAGLLLGATIHFALADGANDLSPNALQTLNVLDGDIWMAFNPALGVMMLGAAGSLLPGVRLSRWLGWAALVLGIALFIPYADFFALLASGLWVLVTSVALLRGRAEGTYATAPGIA